MDNPENLYSLKECLLWLKQYFENAQAADVRYVGNRPFKYVEYGFRELKRAQQRLHLTAIAACGLGVLIGLGIGWFWFGA